MEFEACGVKRHSHTLQQTPYFDFGIRDQPFVQQVMNGAGLHAIEMLHHVQIVTVKAANRGQAIGKRDSSGVMLFEVRQAASEGMATGIDDRSVRQGKSDKSNIQPVGGSLSTNRGRSVRR